MIEQQKGLLYLVRLNNTSFLQNPGRMNLPAGKYVVEIREGAFSYKVGYAADVEVSYMREEKKRVRLPELGRFKSKETAQNVYQGLAVEFEHDGGVVEVYNPRPANHYFGKILGECVVGVWDGKMFGSPSGVFEPAEYKPVGENNILILTSDTSIKSYNSIDANLTWQSDLTDFGKYNLVVIPPESFSFLYKIRDKNCLDPYLRSGGRIYLVGAAPQYLSYFNTLPFELPWYMDGDQYNSIAAPAGDMIAGDSNYIKLNSSLTVPMIKSKGGLAYLRTSDELIGKGWCAAKRFEHNKAKVVWSSFFLMDYEYTEKWNKLVLDQIEWLLK